MNPFACGRTTTVVWAFFFLAFAFASPRLTHGGEASVCTAPLGTNSANLAVIPWGNPQYTDGNRSCYPWPAWVLAAGMDGGLWIANDTWYGWQPSLGDWTSDLATNRLLIQLDRALVASNLWIAVAGTGDANATLLAGFYDDNLLCVAEPMTLHVVETPTWPATGAVERPATSGVEWFTNSIDLSQCPSATVISLSATNGMMRVFSTALYRESAAPTTSSLPPATSVAQEVDAADSAGLAAASAGDPATLEAATDGDAPIGLAKHATVPSAWYVDGAHGLDSYDGKATANVPSSSTGPKRTIGAALVAATPGDTIYVAAGVYAENVQFSGVNMVMNGLVVLQ